MYFKAQIRLELLYEADKLNEIAFVHKKRYFGFKKMLKLFFLTGFQGNILFFRIL